ncbi:MAG: gliding motility-associated C-terminal domain-containing protein [Bacteroidota bacterium]|nr:gliding motility-associated C-terminal domain-containing protein [Bacteroidota bacterium]
MNIKKILVIFSILFVFAQSNFAQGVLPYTQDNICLDQLITVNNSSIAPSYPKNLVVQDLNNDGKKEVIVADANLNVIKIYSFNSSTATFSLMNYFNVPGSGFSAGTGKFQAIGVGNFSGDALLDIVFTTSDTIFVFKQNATPSFNFSLLNQIGIPSNFVNQEHYLVTDNINNNGFDEFYLISSSTAFGPGVTIIPYLSISSNFIQTTPYTIFKSAGSLINQSLEISIGNVKADVDGLKDLMITYSAVKDSVFFLDNNSAITNIILNPIPLYIAPTITLTPDFSITSSEMADVNGDSKLDFLFYGNSLLSGDKMVVCIGLNAFFLTPQITLQAPGIKINDFKIKDINNDNIPDFVAVGNYTLSTFSGMVIFPGNSTTSYFDAPTTITFTNNSLRPDELQIADLDNNGVNDILIKPWKANLDKTYLIPNFSFKVNVSATPSVVCSALAATLTAINTSTSTNYNWEFVPTSSVVSTSSTFTTITTGNYVASLDIDMYSNYTCTQKSDTIKIISNAPIITLSSGNNLTVCYGNTISATASGAATYLWASPTNSNLSASSTFSAQGLSNITYTVEGTLLNGCKGTNTLNINLFPLNTDNISASKNPACAGDKIALSFSSALSYSWNTNETSSTIMVTPNISTNYQLIIKDVNGCTSTKNISIEIDPNCGPVIYHGITINGDGVNDVFTIDNIENYKGNSVSIFNRWGKEIFNTTNYDNKNNYWPTQEHLKNLTPSTYFYVINFGDNSEIQKGWVELIKN